MQTVYMELVLAFDDDARMGAGLRNLLVGWIDELLFYVSKKKKFYDSQT